jgi:hypothetical protein
VRLADGKTEPDGGAGLVGCAPATVTKIENASNAAPPAYVALMLELYGLTAANAMPG